MECASPKYSLELPDKSNSKQQCKVCPSNAQYCHKQSIKPRMGYWVENNLTDILYLCYNLEANCENGEQSQCSEGHIGALCESCDTLGQVWGSRYARGVNYSCVKCADIRGNNLLVIAISLAIVIYILVTVC